MESGFEDRLRVYRDAAQFELDKKSDAFEALEDSDIQQAQEVLDLRLNEVSQEVLKLRNANPRAPEPILEAEQKVKNIQLQKQQVMAELKRCLVLLDEPGRHQIGDDGGWQTRFVDNELEASSNGVDWESITVGELVTDREWGSGFTVKTGKIPREICKTFLVERAKSQINSLLNEQILADQLSNRFIDTGKKTAYQSLLDERRAIPRFGHVVEVMVKNYLTKLAYDHGLDISIELGDVYDDVENKIDFVIRRTGHTRGVGVQQDLEVDTLAVQFTINTQEDVLAHKQHQVSSARSRLRGSRGVDDIALVSVGANVSAEMVADYNQWLKAKAPGGPDKLLSSETKEAIFKLVLEKMYSPEELDDKWQEMQTPTAS